MSEPVTPQSELPGHAEMDWGLAAQTAASGRLVFATAASGPVVMNPNEDLHTLVVGSTASGKTALLQSMVYSALLAGGEVHIIDPVCDGAQFEFARPYASAVATTIPAAEKAVTSLYSEVLRRKNLIANYGVETWLDLPDTIRPPHIYVVVDELSAIIPTPKSAAASEKAETQRRATNDAKLLIGAGFRTIAGQARTTGVTFLLSAGRLSAQLLDSLPVDAVRDSLSRFLLGAATYGEKLSVLKNPAGAPEFGENVPRGRGLWEPSGSAKAEVIQGWYATQEQYGEHLAAAIPERNRMR